MLVESGLKLAVAYPPSFGKCKGRSRMVPRPPPKKPLNPKTPILPNRPPQPRAPNLQPNLPFPYIIQVLIPLPLPVDNPPLLSIEPLNNGHKIPHDLAQGEGLAVQGFKQRDFLVEGLFVLYVELLPEGWGYFWG